MRWTMCVLTRGQGRACLRLEALDNRWVPSITSSFDDGMLTIEGNGEADDVAITREDDGTFTVASEGGVIDPAAARPRALS